jgi:hypothetical protein
MSGLRIQPRAEEVWPPIKEDTWQARCGDLPQERWLFACLLPPLKISRLAFLEVFLSARNVVSLLLLELICSRTRRTGQPIAQ